jgi:hypothetical protein
MVSCEPVSGSLLYGKNIISGGNHFYFSSYQVTLMANFGKQISVDDRLYNGDPNEQTDCSSLPSGHKISSTKKESHSTSVRFVSSFQPEGQFIRSHSNGIIPT